MKKKKVYIAGPISLGNSEQNTRAAIDAGQFVRRVGHIPFIPHLAWLWQLIYPATAEEWYAYDNEWLAVCDALLRLPGKSYGADNEVRLAERLGLPVFYTPEVLRQWLTSIEEEHSGVRPTRHAVGASEDPRSG